MRSDCLFLSTLKISEDERKIVFSVQENSGGVLMTQILRLNFLFLNRKISPIGGYTPLRIE